MSDRPVGSGSSGFEGSIGSLPLVDLLQVWAMKRFSGLVAVNSRGRTGHLYFVEGEIVHAEAGGVTGEPAVRVIIGWPEGSFELVPSTTTLHRTIEKSSRHLLLDAHRELDEHRRTIAAVATATPPPAAAPQAREPSKASVLDQIRAIPGVTQVVRFGKDGRPMVNEGPQAEALAAKGLYLSMTHGAWVAAAFGLHELGIVTLQGERESFVLIHHNDSYLCVAGAPGVPMEPVLTQLRGLLSGPAGR